MLLGYVPEGQFTMGSADSDPEALANERPQHDVFLDAFWMDITEVTNAMFAQFAQETGYQTEAEKAGKSLVWANDNWTFVTGANWRHPRGPGSDADSLGNYPVVQVSSDDAAAYCRWAGRRLPTEAEWEKAARGTDAREYPWGNQDVAGNLANFGDASLPSKYADQSTSDGYEFTAPVGSFPDGKSPYGMLDMAGNVWNWVADWYGENYYAASPAENPSGPPTGEVHVLRGGSWVDTKQHLRSAYRIRFTAAGWLDNIGFRCAVSAAAANALLPSTSTPGPAAPAAGDHSKLIAFYSNRTGSNEIYTMATDGSDVTQWTSNAADNRLPAWSPDGRELAYDSNGSGRYEIYILNLATKQNRLIVSTPCNNYAPVWSPDGRVFAYYADCNGNREVYTVNADGTNAQRLTNVSSASSWYPSWSPDGRQVLFSSNRSGSFQVFAMNSDGSSRRALAQGCMASYSPDGQQIVYSSQCDGMGDLHLMNADGTNARISPNSAGSGNPAWSPDGTQIVFESNRSGQWQVYKMAADGSNFVRLTSDSSEDLAPVWQS